MPADHPPRATRYFAPNPIARRLLAALAGLTLAAHATAQTSPATAPAIVYQSRYDDPANLAHWSKPQTDKTERLMLGRFYNVTESLTLPTLPPHAFVRLKAQLFIMDSWDGNNPGDGPDQLAIRLGDGRTLLRATFAPYARDDSRATTPPSQSFPDNYGTGNYPGLTGAAEHERQLASPKARKSGGTNAVYNVEFTFPHTAADLRIDFVSALQDSDPTINNESWGLGNIEVSVLSAAPVNLDPQQVSRLVADLVPTIRSSPTRPLHADLRRRCRLSTSSARPSSAWFRHPPTASPNSSTNWMTTASPSVRPPRRNSKPAVRTCSPNAPRPCRPASPRKPSPAFSKSSPKAKPAPGPHASSAGPRSRNHRQRKGPRLPRNASTPPHPFRTWPPFARPAETMTTNRAVLSVKISQVITLLNDPAYAMAYQDVATRAAPPRKCKDSAHPPRSPCGPRCVLEARHGRPARPAYQIQPPRRSHAVKGPDHRPPQPHHGPHRPPGSHAPHHEHPRIALAFCFSDPSVRYPIPMLTVSRRHPRASSSAPSAGRPPRHPRPAGRSSGHAL